MSLSDHRTALTEALDPAIPMTALRSKDRMVQHIGLWGVWWGNDSTIPDGMKIILPREPPTPHTLLGGSVSTTTVVQERAPPNRTTLADLPWVILQLQSLAPSDPIWEQVVATLQTEIGEQAQREQGADTRCPGRLTYDPSQDAHNFRRVAEADVLQGYAIERIDDPGKDAVGPGAVMTRTRIPYRVFRGGISDRRAQPVRVFLERPLPRRQQVAQRLQAESGFAQKSDLMAAVGEWRTWIVLDTAAAAVQDE